MNRETCRRLWEAEAIQDGRLTGASRESFERHARDCATCSREKAALEDLARLCEADQRPTLSPLARRRMRAALLRRANQQTVAAKQQHSWWLAAAAALALFVGGAAVYRHRAPQRPSEQPVSVTKAAPRYDVRDVERANWHAESDSGQTFVKLADGTAAFHVEHLEQSQRFIVRMPDGELEVKGTRFEVNVSKGATRSVNVSEGVVELRLTGVPVRVLRAGEHWEQAPVAASVPASVSAAPMTASEPRTPPSAPSAKPDDRARIGEEFASAMASFRDSNWNEADTKLAAFVRQHPTDPRAEDAAYLRIAVHRKLGDEPGAVALAKAYVQMFPRGFRVAEAQLIIDAAE
jgi:ferric-dicitrate binding protein FerR (iron transport regulator)